MGFKTPKWAATPARMHRFAHLETFKDGELIEDYRVGSKACYLLGRNEDICDIGLQHPSISRQHAAILHDKDAQINVMDLKSAQGTFVNDEEIEPNEPRPLKDGDRIRFGASSRTYIFRTGKVDEEQPSSVAVKDVESIQGVAMDELPTSFGGKKQKRVTETEDVVRNAGTLNSDTAALARRKREEEIAAMTAQMMAAPPMADQPSAKNNTANSDDGADGENADMEDKGDDASSDSDDEDGAKDDVAARYNVPMSHEVLLSSHFKGLSCIAVDAPGARVATGSMDYHVKLWDFAGMARHVRPFRDVEVEDGHPLVAVSYSPSGDRLLTASGSSQPKVISREGVEEMQFAKGDMYVMDMANTNGHTHTVTGGAWHPRLRDQMITSSLDGTVRIWNLNGKQTLNKLINATVLKLKSKRGRRCGVTTCRYNLDGTLIAGGTMDGQIQCFDTRKTYSGASITIRDAHAEGGGDLGISCVRFSPDGKYFASRACSDDMVKIWDLRKTKECVKAFKNVDGVFGTTNLAFNSTGTCIVAGTCVRKGQGMMGRVLFLDVHTPGLLDPIASINMNIDESAICVEWHHGINQIFVGTSSGSCRVFYNPQMSQKGVMLSATKKLKVQSDDFGVRIDGVGKVHNPHSLPMYRDEMSKKRKFHKIRSDPKQSKAPEKPITGPGMGGKISGSTTFTQYFMSNHIKTSFREEDPREAILKYAKKAQEEPQYTTAYATSQPTGKIDSRYQLAKQTLEEEKLAQEEEERRLLQP